MSRFQNVIIEKIIINKIIFDLILSILNDFFAFGKKHNFLISL